MNTARSTVASPPVPSTQLWCHPSSLFRRSPRSIHRFLRSVADCTPELRCCFDFTIRYRFQPSSRIRYVGETDRQNEISSVLTGQSHIVFVLMSLGNWLLSVHITLITISPGLYPGPGLYANPGFYLGFYGGRKSFYVEVVETKGQWRIWYFVMKGPNQGDLLPPSLPSPRPSSFLSFLIPAYSSFFPMS